MKIINLTPHPIHLLDGAGNVDRTIPSSGLEARLKIEELDTVNADGIRFAETTAGRVHFTRNDDVVDFTPPRGAIIIVSTMMRADMQRLFPFCLIASPYPLVRDGDGKVIGAKGLAIEPDMLKITIRAGERESK